MKVILITLFILFLLGACGYHTCPTYAQTMEAYIPSDSTVEFPYPIIVMDVGTAASYYADRNKLEDLREQFPKVSSKIDSLQQLTMEADSMRTVIIARLEATDSLSTVQLATCEDKSNAILREAKRQDARAEKNGRNANKFRKQRNVLLGSTLSAIALILILL